MTDISVFTDEDLSGIGIGPEHGVAMSRINSLITEVNDINDYNIVAKCVGLDLKQTAGEAITGTLNGNSTKNFIPTEVLVLATAQSGTAPAEGALKVGTSAAAGDILAASAVHSIDAIGESLRFPISTKMGAIAGNATIHVTSTTKEDTATTFTVNVYVIGKQF